MVLPPEPLVGSPAHPLGLPRERLRHVRAAAKAPADVLCPVQSPVHLVIPLALVAEIVAVSAQKVSPRSVQDSDPSAAPRSGTDEPRPLSSEVAGRPGKLYRLPDVLPLAAHTSPVAVGEGQSIVVGHAAYGAGLPSGPRPAQGEPVCRLEQPVAVEVADVDALALIGGGLLVEPVPVAATRAAHNFSFSLFVEIIREVYRLPI